MIKITILRCGTTIVDEALPLSNRSKNPFAYTGIARGKKHKIEVPVTAYLIEHPDAIILVDTGWDTAIRKDARKYEGFANYFASPEKLPEGQAVTEHLDKLGYAPGDIDYCILTHMDIDHAGGLQLIKDAKCIMTSKAEWAACRRANVRYLKRLWKDIDIVTFSDNEVDLLGDGSIMLMPFHGHSEGMTAVKVSWNDKYAILAGDSGYCRESWEEQVLPGIVWDRRQALESIRKLKSLSEDANCVGIFATHDREIQQSVITL